MSLISDSTNLNSNSFCDVAFADNYFATRLYSNTYHAALVADKEAALITASRLISTLRFKSEKSDSDQLLAFPRVDYNEFPVGVQLATCELAIRMLSEDVTAKPDSLGISKMKAGSLEIEYDGTNSNQSVGISADVTRFMSEFMQRGVKLYRA